MTLCSPQVPLLWHSGEGDLSLLRRDVLQEGSGVGERNGEERGHEADSGVFTALQTRDAPARVSKCQRPKFACQPARRKGKQNFLKSILTAPPPFSYSHLSLPSHHLCTPFGSSLLSGPGPSLGLHIDKDLEDLYAGSSLTLNLLVEIIRSSSGQKMGTSCPAFKEGP